MIRIIINLGLIILVLTKLNQIESRYFGLIRFGFEETLALAQFRNWVAEKEFGNSVQLV